MEKSKQQSIVLPRHIQSQYMLKRLSSAQSLASSSNIDLSFTTVAKQSGNLGNVGYGVKVQDAGLYLIHAEIQLSAGSPSFAAMRIVSHVDTIGNLTRLEAAWLPVSNAQNGRSLVRTACVYLGAERVVTVQANVVGSGVATRADSTSCLLVSRIA